MTTIVEYRPDKRPVNAYPAKIVSPPFPSQCCGSSSDQVGGVHEQHGWPFMYHRCAVCGFTVRRFGPRGALGDGTGVKERGGRQSARPLGHPRRAPTRLKSLPGLVLAIVLTLIASANPLHAESKRTMRNLRGDQVLVPADVPPRERFVLQRVISVDNRLVVFLYHNPTFRHPVDYSETYTLEGELLEIAWYEPARGLKRARDISLGNPKITGVARILEIIHERRALDRQPANGARERGRDSIGETVAKSLITLKYLGVGSAIRESDDDGL